MNNYKTIKTTHFISLSHIKHDISNNIISIKHIIRDKGFNIKTNSCSSNIMLFIISGKIKICLNEKHEYISNSDTIIFIPRNSNFDITYIERSEVVTTTFQAIKQTYSKKLFQMLAVSNVPEKGKQIKSTFPALHFNNIIREYLNDVRKFITNPINKGCKCEVFEDDFFIVFGVYYEKEDLMRLFFPILDNPQLIK